MALFDYFSSAYRDIFSGPRDAAERARQAQLAFQQGSLGIAAPQQNTALQNIYTAASGGFSPTSSFSPQGQYPDYASQLKAMQDQYNRLLAGTRPANVDVAGLYSRARAGAEGAVNPYYTKKYNTLLAEFQSRRDISQRNYERAQQELATNLAQRGEDIGTERQRTGEDVERNLGELTAQERFLQRSEGSKFANALRALEGDVAQSGLAGSGLGGQAIAGAKKERNIAESEQRRSFNVQREAQKLFKERTFADLALSQKRGETEGARRKEYAKIDLDQLMSDLARQEDTDKYTLEETRLGAVSSEQQRQARLGFYDFLNSLSPQQRQATASAYSGAF